MTIENLGMGAENLGMGADGMGNGRSPLAANRQTLYTCDQAGFNWTAGVLWRFIV
jgi:hypothetical protein